jgi:hypothetical protein
MPITAQRLVIRVGMSQEIPALAVGEMGMDIDLHRLRLGDGSTTPIILMGSKSRGGYEFNFIDYVQFPEIRMLPDGKVDGVDISDLNVANGFVVRRGNNLWAHRAMTNSDGYIRIQNPLGTANNPIFDLDPDLVARFDDWLTEVAVDDITIHGDGTAAAPLFAQVADYTHKGVAEIATNTEVRTGTDETRIVTPAGLSSRTATETRTGILEVATFDEVAAGTSDEHIITPKKLKLLAGDEDTAGLLKIATQAETNAGVIDTKAISPKKLHNRTATFTRTGIIRKATYDEVFAHESTDTVVVPAYLHDYVEYYVEMFGGKGGGWATTGEIFDAGNGGGSIGDGGGYHDISGYDAFFWGGSGTLGRFHNVTGFPDIDGGGGGGDSGSGGGTTEFPYTTLTFRATDGWWYAVYPNKGADGHNAGVFPIFTRVIKSDVVYMYGRFNIAYWANATKRRP